MSAIANIIVALLTKLLPLLGTMSGGAIGNIITLLEQVIPISVKEATDLVAPIQNIISELQGSGVVTSDQLTALAALSAKIDAEFDAAQSAAGV
jgi:hypothetical protein